MTNYDIYSKLQIKTKRFGSATLSVDLAGDSFFSACNNFINNNLAKIEQRQKHNDDLRAFIVKNCGLEPVLFSTRPDINIYKFPLPPDYRNMLGLIGIYEDKDGNEQTISLKRKTSKSESYVDAFTEPSDELLFWDVAIDDTLLNQAGTPVKLNQRVPQLLVYAPSRIQVGIDEFIPFNLKNVRIDYIRTIESVLERNEIEFFPFEFDQPNLSDQDIENYKTDALDNGNFKVYDVPISDEIAENLISLSTAVVSENLESPRTPTTDYKAREEVLME